MKRNNKINGQKIIFNINKKNADINGKIILFNINEKIITQR